MIPDYAEPDAHTLTVELRTALGMFAGAMPISPKEAWDQAIARVRAADAEIARLKAECDRLDAFEDWLSDRVGPTLHIDSVRDALAAAT